MLRAVLVATFLIPYTVLFGVLSYLSALLSRSPRPLYWAGRTGVKGALMLAGIRVQVDGGHRVQEIRNVLFLSNHASLLDPPILFQALKHDFRAVSKTEVFRLPILSRCLRLAGFIEVERGNPKQSHVAMERMADALRTGGCFLAFPEGTRTQTGELGSFRKGVFVAAILAGSRIIPVALHGTRSLLPRGGFRIRSGQVRVEVLDPVDARGYSYESRNQLVAEVRHRIANALECAE